MSTPRRILFDPSRFDAGWLFLAAGAALLCSAVLIPASDDLAEARFRRDRALVLRDLHADRLDRHHAYLDAVKAADPTVIEDLAATHLNMVRSDHQPLPGAVVPTSMPAVQFDRLEPQPRPGPQRRRVDSALERWTTSDGSRLWLIALGALAILLGLVPPWEYRRSDDLDDASGDNPFD